MSSYNYFMHIILILCILMYLFSEDSSKKHPFPCPSTYRTALSYYLDITSKPRTHIFKELVEYTTDDKDKEILKLLGGMKNIN